MIKFDLDGTLIDLVSITDQFMVRSGFKRVRPQLQYRIKAVPEISKAQMWDIFYMVYDHWRITPILDGAHQIMEILWHLTAEPIQIITARPPKGVTSAVCILNRIMMGIPYNIAFVDSAKDKYLHLGPDDVLVEDRRRTCLELAEIGVRTVMIKNEYNEIPGKVPYITKIQCLKDLIPLIPDLLSTNR